MRLNNLKNKKIAILGFGREGKSVLNFLFKHGLTRINTDKKPGIWILDRDPKIRQLCISNLWLSPDSNLHFQLGKNYLKNLDQFDIVFRSPGVPYNLLEIQKAIKKGVKFSSVTQLFFEQIEERSKVSGQKSIVTIGITGTKGKGTTATLLYKILKACGKNVYLAGNIGKPALDILSNTQINADQDADKRRSISVNQRTHQRESAYIILELSSFQLQDLKYSPNIAIVLGLFPDHLDAHKNFKEYFEAKANIAKWQKKTDKIFYFADNKYANLIAQKSKGKKTPIHCQAIDCPSIKKIFGVTNSQKLIKLPGFHNLKNTLMAATVALSLGCPKEKILKVIKNFRGNEHRLELIRTIHGYARIRKQINTDKNKIRVHPRSHLRSSVCIKFYNDSASTNPQTTVAAIQAFSEPKILIAGGKDKGLNYSPLAKALKNSHANSAPPCFSFYSSHSGNANAPTRIIQNGGVKLVILFGENKNKIAKAIKNSGIPIKLVKDLKTAVNLSYKTAKKLLRSMVNGQWSKVIILFSPASASFDMFKDYAERGEKFKELVKKLKR